MKNTIENMKNHLAVISTETKEVTKKERDENFKLFTESTYSELSKGMLLATKESNAISSVYGIQKNFIECLKEEKLSECENSDLITCHVYAKIMRFASRNVSSALIDLEKSIYATYEPLKKGNFEEYSSMINNLLGIPSSREFYDFNRAYMFTTEKQLSRKAYAKKFVELVTGMKLYQKNFSEKYENVTFKHVTKDVKVTTINPDSITMYEELKAYIHDAGLSSKMVNDNMGVDMKLISQAKKVVVSLTEEEYAIYSEIFKK